MGIYPTYTRGPETVLKNGSRIWTEECRGPGYVNRRVILAEAWKEVERTDCFCCSCDPESSTQDGACRNHGYYASRPCEVHHMAGSPDDDGVMPISVQAQRAAQQVRSD